MGKLQNKVEAVLAPHLTSGEAVELVDYGALAKSALGTAALMSGWQILTGSSTSAHKSQDYVAVAVTASEIIVLPVKFKTGLLGMSLAPVKKRDVQRFDRQTTQITTAPLAEDQGMWNQDSIQVRIDIDAETSCVVEFYDNPHAWPAITHGVSL